MAVENEAFLVCCFRGKSEGEKEFSRERTRVLSSFV